MESNRKKIPNDLEGNQTKILHRNNLWIPNSSKRN